MALALALAAVAVAAACGTQATVAFRGKRDGRTVLDQARSALAEGRAGAAESVLARASEAAPSDPEPWRLRLELLRVEDRMVDAQRVGWEAYEAVPPGPARLGVLRGLTLAVLADLPDDFARATLARWSAASGTDPDARVALLQRFGAMPRAGDPDRDQRIAELAAVLARDPGHLAAREGLVSALADAGERERGRELLDAWPEPGRDARYWRLLGRWDLEYDRRPDRAAASFQRALTELPHDWKTRVRLARALRALGFEAEARREAEAVGRLRERLDPTVLGPRLADDLARADRRDPAALADLADLCASAGLSQLADAWRREASPR